MVVVCRKISFLLFFIIIYLVCPANSQPFYPRYSHDNKTDLYPILENLPANSTEKTLFINELMAGNAGYILDPQGDSDDWIEIYNSGNQAIDIGGMYLTDNFSNPTKWQIPDGDPSTTTIFPQGYLLIWADSETNEGTLHADFKLSSEGEEIGLFDIDAGTLIDGVTYSTLPENSSYGRLPDGGDNWQVFETPTPGQSNRDTTSGDVLITEIMYHSYHPDSGAEDIGQEYIELYNRGSKAVSLSGWEFVDGIKYVFPDDVTIEAGEYLVVAANVNTFIYKYQSDAKTIGGWSGHLSNSGETIELVDNNGIRIDILRYADEGDWARRELGPVDNNHRGWTWIAEHNGLGKSLELINSALPNDYGQNWAASKIDKGTPGRINSVANDKTAPLILDVVHSPVIPGPADPVTVNARIIFKPETSITVTIYYRVDISYYSNHDTYPHFESNDYRTLPMFDDGFHDDGQANDGIYGAELSAQSHGTIVEFFIEAKDTNNNIRTWPAPSFVDGQSEQVTNLLYQVDDTFVMDAYQTPGNQPTYYLIMTEMERERLANLGNRENDSRSHAEMNGTFISVDSKDIKLRYNVGIRNRGNGSRRYPPNNYRVNFKSDNDWNGVTAININSKYTYLQYLGSILFHNAGMPAAEAAPVQVRVNGENLALDDPSKMYGSYVQLEVYDSEWAKNHLPDDPDGNIYRCISYGHDCDLQYLGEDPNAYSRGNDYVKNTNSAENDWFDLVNLTYALDESSDETYVQQVNQIINVDQWIRWFAIETLLSNHETNLSNGYGDDYLMYRGIRDPRFILLPHDLDTILRWSERENSIWQATALPVIRRFLRHPEFIERYYAQLNDLIGTVFAPENFNPLIEQSLGGWVPQSKIDEIKDFMVARTSYVLSEIPTEFTMQADMLRSEEYYKTNTNAATFYGEADAIKTNSVLVNGQPTGWPQTDSPWETEVNTIFQPGANRVVAQTLSGPDRTGNELKREFVDDWYNDGDINEISGTITDDTTLDAASGPWNVTGDLIVPTGVTLTIEPGTTLFFNEETGIVIEQGGRIIAQGTDYERIRLTRMPGSNSNWNGIKFYGTLEDNLISYLDQEFGDDQGESIDIQGSRVLIDNVTWSGTNTRILNLAHPSAIISNSIFPSINTTEPIHGSGLSGNEYLIFDDCIFGTAAGYNDIIDFTGGRRPGPIIQIYDCTFLGGGDDGLDLDGTDAHIEGNIFMNFHQANGSDSTSNAIATGKNGSYSSKICIARNIFVNNDHAVLLKENCYLQADNNTFVNSSIAVISFGEPYRKPPRTPGKGAFMEGNIFWNNTKIFEHFFQEPYPAYGPNEVAVYNSILPEQWHYLGMDNIDADPLFVDEPNDFHLKPDSVAIGAGLWGLDMGALVPAGAVIYGEPDNLTYQRNVTLTIGGPGITHYKFRVNNGPWSDEQPVNIPVVLTNMGNGQTYTVYVIGKNSADLWQDEENPAVSRTWTIDASVQN